jgi:hypothetical protein
MDYPYNLFKTKDIIQFNKSDMFNYTTSGSGSEKSILSLKEKEINKYILEKGINIKNLNQLGVLNKISDNIFKTILLKDNNIIIFSKKLIGYKHVFLDYKRKIDTFLEISKKENSTELFTYENPIDYLELLSMNKSSFNLFNLNYTNYSDDIKLILDCIVYPNVVNLSLPSLGPIYLLLSKKKNNFVDFTEYLLNNLTGEIDIVSNLPIIELKIEKKMSKVLSSSSYNINFNNSNNQKINYIKLIENNIKSIKIRLEDILLEKGTDKVKNEYYIPYKIEKSKIVPIKKMEFGMKITNIITLIRHNFELVNFVIQDTFKLNDITGQKNLDKDNYKNVLFCFLFFIIQLLSDIQKEYVNRINMILNSVVESSGNINYGNINLEKGFLFISELNNSVYKFKTILLNNLYQLFIPSSILKNYYGMNKDEMGFFVPDNIFLSTSDYIYNNYPFDYVDEFKENNLKKIYRFTISKNKIIKFMGNIKNKSDVYDQKNRLEYGGNSMTESNMKKSLKILTNYFNFYEKNNGFYIFIIDNLIDIFLNKNIPYELLNNILPYKSKLKNSTLKKEEKEKMVGFLFTIFDDNLQNSTNLTINLYELINKIKTNSIINDNIFREREFLKLSANMFYYLAKIIILIVKKSLPDGEIKINLIRKMNDKILYYQNILGNTIKTK